MNIKYIIFAIIVVLSIKNISPAIAVEVSSDIAKNKINNLIYHHIIDTRNDKERETGYHAYSMSISSDNLNSMSDKIKNKYRKLLIISKTGERASQDAEQVTSMGYRNVEYLNDVWTRLI